MPFIVHEYFFTYYLMIHFNIIAHFNLGFPKYVLLSDFPFKISYLYLNATCSTHLIHSI